MKSFALLLLMIILMTLVNSPAGAQPGQVAQAPTTAPATPADSTTSSPGEPIPPVERINPADGALVVPTSTIKEEVRESERELKKKKDAKSR